MPDTGIGLLAVIAGGLLQGSFMLPMKWTTRWAWENTWLVFASTAYLLCPWLLVLTTIPQAVDVYSATSPGILAVVMLFGLGWGLGAVTFGLGVDAVGLALGFAIILGVAASVGVIVPLFFLPALPSSGKLLVTALSLAIMLLGVFVCSMAGRWKETQPARMSYGRGVAICVISGLLSACGNLGFAFGQPVIDSAQAAGVPSYLASNVVWALLTAALFICNAAYAILLLLRNRTAANFRLPGTGQYFFFGFLMGAMWMGGFVFYGAGARRLGELGPSLGWAILMSSMVLTANILGIVTGEWKSAPSSATRVLTAGLGLLFIAIVGLGYSNTL
jgi:L-rhamnose-H+ transport protein